MQYHTAVHHPLNSQNRSCLLPVGLPIFITSTFRKKDTSQCCGWNPENPMIPRTSWFPVLNLPESFRMSQTKKAGPSLTKNKTTDQNSGTANTPHPLQGDKYLPCLLSNQPSATCPGRALGVRSAPCVRDFDSERPQPACLQEEMPSPERRA